MSIGKQVTLTSDRSKPATVAATVIDASGAVNGIVVAGPGARGTAVAGLTVRNARRAGILVVQTSKVTIEDNVVTANDLSCAGYQGWFNPTSSLPAPPGTSTYTNDVPCGNPDFAKNPGQDCEALHLVSVTDSLVLANTVRDNLDGGIYLTDEAGANSGNLVEGNGMPGIVVHAHTPGQNMNGNVITDNFVSGNGAGIGDPDAGLTPVQTAGIDIFSKAGPLTGTHVQGDAVADERFGVWLGSLVQQPAVSGNVAVGAHVGALVKVAAPHTN